MIPGLRIETAGTRLGRWPHEFVLLAFVASHPFAGKTAKGWGTETIQNDAAKGFVAGSRRAKYTVV